MSLATARRPPDDVSTILVDVCRQSAPNHSVPPGAESDLVEAARFHRVAPLVHVAHRETAPHVAELFSADRLRAIAFHLQACAALQEFGAVLGDTAWVTFKGPVLSEHAHPVPGLRTYNDVDVLVAPSSFRAATRLLLAAGWRVADYQDILRNRAVPGEMHWLSPSGVLFDMHWSMVNMASRRRRFDIPTSQLLGRRVPVSLGPEWVWTLDPTDSLVHACLHAALAGANKLVYLVDVDRLSRAVDDWDEVATRSRQWRAQAQVALVLGRAQRVLETPVPRDFGARAQVPRSIRGMAALTDRVAPVPQVRTNTGFSKFIARAVRSTGSATAAAVGRNAAGWLSDRARGPRAVADERLGADEASLQVYLQAVETAGAAAGEVPSAAST